MGTFKISAPPRIVQFLMISQKLLFLFLVYSGSSEASHIPIQQQPNNSSYYISENEQIEIRQGCFLDQIDGYQNEKRETDKSNISSFTSGHKSEWPESNQTTYNEPIYHQWEMNLTNHYDPKQTDIRPTYHMKFTENCDYPRYQHKIMTRTNQIYGFTDSLNYNRKIEDQRSVMKREIFEVSVNDQLCAKSTKKCDQTLINPKNSLFYQICDEEQRQDGLNSTKGTFDTNRISFSNKNTPRVDFIEINNTQTLEYRRECTVQEGMGDYSRAMAISNTEGSKLRCFPDQIPCSSQRGFIQPHYEIDYSQLEHKYPFKCAPNSVQNIIEPETHHLSGAAHTRSTENIEFEQQPPRIIDQKEKPTDQAVFSEGGLDHINEISPKESLLLITKEIGSLYESHKNHKPVILDLCYITDKSGAGYNALEDLEYIGSYPKCCLPKKQPGVVSFISLIVSHSGSMYSFAKTVIIIPMSIANFRQYNQFSELVPIHRIKDTRSFVLNFDLTFSPIDKEEYKATCKHKCELTLPENEKYEWFLKDKFVAQHGDQMLIITLSNIKNAKLWFLVQDIPDMEKTMLYLRNSRLISKFHEVRLSNTDQSTQSKASNESYYEACHQDLFTTKALVYEKKSGPCRNKSKSRYKTIYSQMYDVLAQSNTLNWVSNIDPNLYPTHPEPSSKHLSRIDDICSRNENILETIHALEALNEENCHLLWGVLHICEITNIHEQKCTFVKKHECFQSPEGIFTKPEKNVIYFFGLFSENEIINEKFGKSSFILPKKYLDFFQHGPFLEPLPGILIRNKKTCTINFDLFFYNISALNHSREPLYGLELTVPAEKKYKSFFKNRFVALHAGQTLMITLLEVQNERLRFGIHLESDAEKIRLYLRKSCLILELSGILPPKNPRYGIFTSDSTQYRIEANHLTNTILPTGDVEMDTSGKSLTELETQGGKKQASEASQEFDKILDTNNHVSPNCSSISSEETLHTQETAFYEKTSLVTFLAIKSVYVKNIEPAFTVINLHYVIDLTGRGAFYLNEHKTHDFFVDALLNIRRTTIPFILALFCGPPKGKFAMGKTSMLVPLLFQGSYQYNHDSLDNSDHIIKCNGYLVMNFGIRFVHKHRNLADGKTVYQTQLVLPAEKIYMDNLKENLVGYHGKQKYMCELWTVKNKTFAFLLNRVPPPRHMMYHYCCQRTLFISESLSNNQKPASDGEDDVRDKQKTKRSKRR